MPDVRRVATEKLLSSVQTPHVDVRMSTLELNTLFRRRCSHTARQRTLTPLFYANALTDAENAFLKFLKTHVDNERKRAEKVYENAQS